MLGDRLFRIVIVFSLLELVEFFFGFKIGLVAGCRVKGIVV